MSRSHSLSIDHRVTHAASAKDLFVDDSGQDAVEILTNKKWKNVGSIADGIDGPDGNWEDTKGNLYVANQSGPDITEYNSSRSLIYTYTGVSDPVDVRTDTHGNVYEADYFGADVNEFGQESNTPIATCDPGGFVEGVAIDTKGDVFVAFFDGLFSYVTEYAGGLSGCNHTNLGVSVLEPAGMIFDKSDNLILCDPGVPAVDVIDPPYNSVSRTLGSGYSDPLHVTINKKNDQAYVADSGTGEVYVLGYPAGKLKATLGPSNGIEDASSAVDGSNYVP
jgi:DNA-binding beta-propeller fold protein YncE